MTNFALFLAFAFSSSLGQAKVLTVGDLAPKLAISDWLKGHFHEFQPGKVYVVEFWATWCGPCKMSMPHLSALQERYGDGVTIVGVASSEHGEDQTKKLSDVKKFVSENDGIMSYVVAFDSNGTMAKTWVEASKQRGIPAAYIVDRDGTIAFIGHPEELDEPLKGVINGTWDKALAKREHLRKEALQAKEEEIEKKVKGAVAKNKLNVGLGLIEEALREEIGQPYLWNLQKIAILVRMNRISEAEDVATKLVNGSYMDNIIVLITILSGFFDNEDFVRPKDATFVYKIAARVETLLPNNPDPATALIKSGLAQVYESLGNSARAEALLMDSIPFLDGTSLAKAQSRLDKLRNPKRVEEKPKSETSQRELACEGGVCAIPQTPVAKPLKCSEL